jgi:hypothetical protein
VVFAPTSAGLKGNNTILGNFPGSLVDVTVASGLNTPLPFAGVRGTGVVPAATLVGNAAFGNQQILLASAAHTFTYTNTGIGPITVSTISLAGANPGNYAIVSNLCSGVTIQAAGNCTFGVTFTPPSTPLGNKPANVTVIDTAGGAPNQTVNLTGSGVQGAEFTAATQGTLSFSSSLRMLAFGNLSGAQTSTVTVTVTGSSSVTFGTATVSNGTGSAFSKGADACSGNTVAVGATCSITVNFSAPTGNSARTGTLSVPDNSTGSPQSMALTGS